MKSQAQRGVHAEEEARHAPAPATAAERQVAASPRQRLQARQIAQLRAAASPRQAAQAQRIAQLRARSPAGLPAGLQAGVEALSGHDLSDVRVHRNSAKPAQMNAHAYAQGRDIHLGPGQERHLPHEAWHVVQQAQGRVRANTEMAGAPVNTDAGLEAEADRMGARSARMESAEGAPIRQAMRPAGGGRGTRQAVLATFDEIRPPAGNGKFSWAKHRTKLDNSNPGMSTRATGFGAKTEAPDTHLKTEVEWAPVHDGSKEGQLMNAKVLGPDHKLGSPPGKDPVKRPGKGKGDVKRKEWNKRRTDLMEAAGKQPYVAGHLLNHNLGGPGTDARNLTAIPVSANNTHSREVETEVKRLVNKEGRFLRYKVKVDYLPDDGPSTLRPLSRIDSLPPTGVWYANKITATWCALDDHKRDQGAESKVTIPIDPPSRQVSDHKGPDPDLSEKALIDTTGDAARALFNPATDVVLTNTGFLSAAARVYGHFRPFLNRASRLDAQIEDLRKQLAALELEKSEWERRAGAMGSSPPVLSPPGGGIDARSRPDPASLSLGSFGVGPYPGSLSPGMFGSGSNPYATPLRPGSFDASRPLTSKSPAALSKVENVDHGKRPREPASGADPPKRHRG